MKNYQKTLTVVAVTMLIVPQLAFASWWNPFTWNIFSFLFHSEPQVEQIISTPQNSEATSSSLSATSSDTVTVSTTEGKPKIELTTPTKKLSPAPIKTLTPAVQVPTSQLTIPQQPTPPISQTEPHKNDDQFCRDTYGHASWDGVSSNCMCDIGYEVSNDGKSCTPSQVVPRISNDQFCKNTYGRYSLWDTSLSSCTCADGYSVSNDGKTCVFVNGTQQTQQSNSSINSPACQTAMDSLTKFQQQYTGAVAGARSTGSSVVANGNVQRLTDEYNTKLPTYQTAVQTACQ